MALGQSVASAIFYGVVCWGSGITATDGKRLDRLIKKSQLCPWLYPGPVEVVGERRMATKLSSLMDNLSHPLQNTIAALGNSFSHRLKHPRCLKEHYRRSFLPADVRL